MSSANFESSDPNVPAVEAQYSGPAGGYAVFATAGQPNASTATTFRSPAIIDLNTQIVHSTTDTQGPPPPRAIGGYSDGGIAIFGQSNTGDGVVGTSVSGIAVHAVGPRAGVFRGNVEVTGDILLTGADCAEEFEIAESVEIEPGTVMVLDQEGRL